MENIENIEINNNVGTYINKIRYEIGKYAIENKIKSDIIKDVTSLVLTVLGKFILPKFVPAPFTFFASYVAIDQFIINCKKYYHNQEMRNLNANLINANNGLTVTIERDNLIKNINIDSYKM